MNSSFLLSQTCLKKEQSCRTARFASLLWSPSHKPQKGCRLGICFEVRMGSSHPSGPVWTAANEKSDGLKHRWGAASLFLRGAHLRAVLSVGPERAVEQDDPVSVEAQSNRLLRGQLGPRGRRPHDTLSFAGDNVKFPYPLQHQVKVHPKAGCRSTCAGGDPVRLVCLSTENSSVLINRGMQLTSLTARVGSPDAPHPD